MIDVLAAHQLKEALLAALYLRERDGKGAFIEASLEEAGIAALANQGSNYLMAGHIAGRIGMQHPNIAPYGDTFKCKDGTDVVLAVGSDAQFRKLCVHLNAAKAADDKLFSTNAARVTHRQELISFLEKRLIKIDSDSFLNWCHREQVPAGAIRNLKEVSESTAGQEMTLESEIEGQHTSRFSSKAFTMHR